MNSLVGKVKFEHETVKGLTVEVEALECNGERQGEIISWKYNDVAVSGVVGNLGVPLERIHESPLSYSPEYGPVKESESGRARGAFIVKPFFDLNVISHKGSFTSIIGIGIDEERVKRTLLKTLGLVDFEAVNLNPDFVQSAHDYLMDDAVGAYNVCKEQARRIKARAPTLFAAYRYAIFLEDYLGKSREDMKRRVNQAFKVAINL